VKQFLITIAGVLVGLFLFVIILPVVLIGMISSAVTTQSAEAQPAAIVLDLDLRSGLTDSPAPMSFPFGGQGSVVETIRALEAASKDDKVKGVFVRANTFGVAPAHAEELHDAIARFRSSGKWVLAHVQNDGIDMSLGGYATIADADEIWLHAAGQMMPMGLTAEQTFFGDTLKKFRVSMQVEAREEFKTALNTFTETSFTTADRESTTALLTGIYDRFVGIVAESRADRGLTAAGFRAAIEETPFGAQRALELKLVDKLGTPEEAADSAIAKAGGDKAGLVALNEYTYKPSGGDTVALVTAEGGIVTGPDNASPFSSDSVIASDVIAQAILDAADDKDVKAIVFRVSSPGGSAVASDQIWRAVETAQARGKKVVVSMGAYAASGGYYISAGADEIVASPTTITGSIGVFGAKFVTGGAMEHYLDARTEAINVGSPNANYFTGARGFTNGERAAFAGVIDRIYDDFLTVVAEGRGMTKEEVRVVAKGRVWTGEAAQQAKLVNTLGGLHVAVERAKALAGIDADKSVTLKLYPREKTPFEAIEALFGVSADGARAVAALAGVMGDERVARVLEETMTERSAVRAEQRVEIR
jgi:protease-4